MLTSFAALALWSAAGAAQNPCERTAGHRGYTILVEESGHFVHCRGGEETESEPLSHERVVLQFPPLRPDQPYRYRLVESGGAVVPSHHPKIFTRQLAIADDLEGALRDLERAPESIGEALQHLEPAGGAAAEEGAGARKAAPVRELPTTPKLEAAKAKYLSVATPAFVDALHRLKVDLGHIGEIADQAAFACKMDGSNVAEGLTDLVAARCAGGGPGVPLEQALSPLASDLERFMRARKEARDALFDASLAPSSESEAEGMSTKAKEALTRATAAAEKLVDDAGPAAQAATKAATDLRFLQAALSIPAHAGEGRRLLLGRFPANGLFAAPDLYQISVAREPSPLFDLGEEEEGQAAPKEKNEVLTDRFQPQPRDWFDIGIALLYSAGLPDHPDLSGREGQQTLVQVPTAGFVGGILASLEPIGLFAPASEWGPILRFPTIIVPFTIDPLSNYFIGGGIGWGEIGAINVGAHLAITRDPASGVYYGETFKTTPIYLDHVTQPGPIEAGYFVSLSLDLVGIAHLIMDERHPTIRDAHTGKPLESGSAPAPAHASAAP